MSLVFKNQIDEWLKDNHSKLCDLHTFVFLKILLHVKDIMFLRKVRTFIVVAKGKNKQS